MRLFKLVFWSFRLFQVCFGSCCCCSGLCLAVLVVLCCLWRQKEIRLFQIVCVVFLVGFSQFTIVYWLFEDSLRLFDVHCCLRVRLKLI